MNRSNISHAVVPTVKYLSVLTGLAAYANFLPGHFGVIAALVFGLASAVKDTLTALEKRLESPEDLVSVAVDTVKDAQQVIAKAEDVVNSVNKK